MINVQYPYYPTYQPSYPMQYPTQPPMPDQYGQRGVGQYQPGMVNQPMQTQVNIPQQTPSQPAPQQGQPSSITGPVFVNGEAGAKGYLVGSGNTVMLIDADPDANTFWLKSADASGMPSMRTFDYVERVNTPKTTAQATVQYATRDELEALADRVNAIAGASAPKSRKSNKEDADDA